MAGTAQIERSYRRWLWLYPTSFRRTHAEEVLAVLMAGTGSNRRRPDRLECFALLRGALGMRLGPRVSRTNRSMFAAVRLMYVGAVVELAVALTVAATMPELRSSLVASDPSYSPSQWHSEVVNGLHPLVISAVVATGFWLWMAWANGRGQRWAPIAFVGFFGLTTFSLLNGLAHGSATYARADLAVGSMLWLVQLGTVGLLFHSTFRRPSAPANS